jgi:catechol 2,3-dioxygenase-like lactoylglutathione lyase family enzyme
LTVLRLDHVVYAVRDLDETAARLRRELGLDSVPGGRHPGWGTGNRIVPLGDDYIELIAVIDPDEAAGHPFGRAVLAAAEGGDRLFATSIATDDIEDVAARLGLEVQPGERARPDGTVLRWRSAGVNDPSREAWLPFFITWDVPAELHPGRARSGHGIRATGIAWVEVSGDADRLLEWLGGEELPIRVVDGPPGLRAAGLATAGGELILR